MLSIEFGTLTDEGLNALAAIHYLKELKLNVRSFTSAAIQSVLESNRGICTISLHGEYVDDALVKMYRQLLWKLKIAISIQAKLSNSPQW